MTAAASLASMIADLPTGSDRVFVIVSGLWEPSEQLGAVFPLFGSPHGRQHLVFGSPDLAWSCLRFFWDDAHHSKSMFPFDLRPNFLSVPYVASYRINKLAIQPDSTCDDISQRTVSFFFAGSLHRRAGGIHRGAVMLAMARESPHALLIDHRPNASESMVELARAYAGHMRRSRYCLVPAGDTATSRRLFDALAAGCEPVYLGPLDDGIDITVAHSLGHVDPYSGQSNLPFRSTLDWSSLVRFVGTLDCLIANNGTGARALGHELESLMAPANDEAWKRGCRERLSAYRRSVSYFPPKPGESAGAATALLHEIYGRRGRRLPRKPSPLEGLCDLDWCSSEESNDGEPFATTCTLHLCRGCPQCELYHGYYKSELPAVCLPPTPPSPPQPPSLPPSPPFSPPSPPSPPAPIAPPPSPSPPILNAQAQCWEQCGHRVGACSDFCGPSGACCRQGTASEDAFDCGYGALGCTDFHCCVPHAHHPWDPWHLSPPARLYPPSPPVLNKYEPCYYQCNSRNGACSFCGPSGACCRGGRGVFESACGFGALGCPDTHCCVEADRRPSPPAPPPHEHHECWEQCGHSAGACSDFCGPSGACCRQGTQSEDAFDCGYGALGCTDFHCCIQTVARAPPLSPPSLPRQLSPPSPPPSPPPLSRSPPPFLSLNTSPTTPPSPPQAPPVPSRSTGSATSHQPHGTLLPPRTEHAPRPTWLRSLTAKYGTIPVVVVTVATVLALSCIMLGVRLCASGQCTLAARVAGDSGDTPSMDSRQCVSQRRPPKGFAQKVVPAMRTLKPSIRLHSRPGKFSKLREDDAIHGADDDDAHSHQDDRVSPHSRSTSRVVGVHDNDRTEDNQGGTAGLSRQSQPGAPGDQEWL